MDTIIDNSEETTTNNPQEKSHMLDDPNFITFLTPFIIIAATLFLVNLHIFTDVLKFGIISSCPALLNNTSNAISSWWINHTTIIVIVVLIELWKKNKSQLNIFSWYKNVVLFIAGIVQLHYAINGVILLKIISSQCTFTIWRNKQFLCIMIYSIMSIFFATQIIGKRFIKYLSNHQKTFQ